MADEIETKQSSTGCLKATLIFLAILVVFTGLYFGLTALLRNLDSSVSKDVTKTVDLNGPTISDPQLIGTWKTPCLIPDSNSPWAEQHIFVINDDGTANHKRLSGENCDSLKQDTDENISYKITAIGKINLTYTDGKNSGQTIYDIYKATPVELRFGSGFCNCTSTEGKFGASDSDRFTKLNDYLIYKKG